MFIAMIVILNIVYTMHDDRWLMFSDWFADLFAAYWCELCNQSSNNPDGFSARDMMVNSVVESTAMLFPEK